MLRRIPVSVLTGAGVVVIIALIGVVAFFASRVIGQTVLEELRSQQLQLTTSVAQQTEAYFNNLNVEIISLAQQAPIRTTQVEIQASALSIIESTVSNRPTIIVSVTRFDSQGRPRYAYPETFNRFISESADYPYTLPPELLELTATRGNVDIATGVYRVARNDAPGLHTYLLIAPVTTLNQNIEFLTYELDMENILNETLALALDDLGDSSSGQLWVLDYDETEDRYLNIYSAKSEPLIATIRDRFTTSILNAIDRPITESYTVREAGQNVQREAALAQAFAVNRPFVLMMSRNASEAREGVDDDLQLILIGSIGAVIVLAFLGMAGTQIIVRETTQRQAETGMRATARSLLEVSRALNSTLELDVVLDRILSEFERLIPYHSASILLLTDQGLEVAAHRGPDVEAHQRIFGWDEARAAREVIARGHPVIINNTAEDERWTVVEGSDIRSWLGLPLKVFERSVGVLNINATTENRFSPQDISLAETFADQASVALQNARLHQIEVTRIEQELNIAQSIQMSLMPVESPDYPDLEFAFHSIPARQVSGDFFQIVPLTDNQVGIFVGDVSGKGMPAAMIMAIISTALRDEVNRHRNPGDLLNVLNKRLIDRLKQNNMNSALLTGLYNPATRSLALANAGMGLPYVRDPDGTWTEIEIGGYPLGSSESTIYGTRTIYFGYGSLVVLYSDGIIEAQNWRGEFFGFERFEALLNTLPADATAPTALDTILQAVHTHLGEETPQDDITLMVIRGLAQEIVREEDEDEDTLPGKERGDSRVWQERFLSRQGILSEKSEGYSMPRENVEVFLPSTLGYEKVARDAAEAIAREMGFSEDRIDDLKTAVAEACMNAIEHGNLEDRSTSVTVLLSAAADSLEIRVSDRGRQTIPNPLPPPGGEDKSRGWGMFFIQSLMDEVEITELPEGGNVVKMTIYLGKDQAASDEEDSASAEK